MSIQVAKDELKALTDFQKDIHLTNDLSETIMSTFYKVFTKCLWYSSIPLKMQCVNDDKAVIYFVNNSFHYLEYSYLRTYFPPMRVKSKYANKVKIAWCHNAGTNQIVEASFVEDDDRYHTFDNVWCDMYFQFYQTSGAGKRKGHNMGVGNVSCMEDWRDSLPAYPINIDQPWFYSTDIALAFPIFYKNSLTRASHRYIFRKKTFDLLRMKCLGSDGKWYNNTKKFAEYLEAPILTLKTPELWGRYAYITENEITYHKSCSEKQVFYIHDIKICDSTSKSLYKSTASIDLLCETPCLAFFWAAENQDAVMAHNYSNYTTNSDDLYSGWDPIRTTTLKYGNDVRLGNMPSDHFSIAEPRKRFPSTPNERGYHGYSYSGDSTSFHADIGVVLSNMKAKLYCKLDNTNIFTNNSYDDKIEEDDEEDTDPDDINVFQRLTDIDVTSDAGSTASGSLNSLRRMSEFSEDKKPEFILRTRLLVIRKLSIENVGRTPTNEGTYKFILH